MTKAETIKATGYTEKELVALALIAMRNRMKEARNQSEDDESYDHYAGLVRAYDKMIIGYENVLRNADNHGWNPRK